MRLIILLFLLNIKAFCQPGETKILPAEIETTINGIEAKIIVVKILGSDQGVFATMILGFKNKSSNDWVYFDAPRVLLDPDSEGMGPFELQLMKDSEDKDLSFLNPFIEKTHGDVFHFKCVCQETKNLLL